MQINGIAHVALTVSNFEAAVPFYVPGQGLLADGVAMNPAGYR
jgi:hypothetical protein